MPLSKNHPILKKLVLLSFLAGSLSPLFCHPIPDIPIIGNFNSDGNSSILVEIDPRCFVDDPESEPFLTASAFKDLSQSDKARLLLQAENLTKAAFTLRFGQAAWSLPTFSFDFAFRDGGETSEENIVLIQGLYHTLLDSNSSFYQIRSLESAPYDLIFTNQIDGKPQRRVNVLFPGEESFKFDLSFIEPIEVLGEEEVDPSGGLAERSVEEEANGGGSTFLSFARQGFVHVLPLGLDHILFVLGLFFLSRKWKPILYQVSVFTVAHTITLGSATVGLIRAPSSVVEPIIAASIAAVALENVFFPKYRHSRLILVFAFGLIHGLGFASVLASYDLDAVSLVFGLLGFNLGVEFGQLTVIAIAFGLTWWIREEFLYRKLVVVPGSIIIAALGIYWTVERVFL